MSRPTTITCRVRGASLDETPTNSSSAFPYEEAQITLSPPLARKRAGLIAQRASLKLTSVVFFVETKHGTKWINKDIWYDGIQYEIVGDRIPGFPPSFHHITLIEA